MKNHSMRTLVTSLVASALTLSLGGCVVAARTPAVYGQYGYTTVAAPSTVYYRGGTYGGVYYRPGYYARTAPFFTQAVYAQPTYVQPGYVQPTYVQPGYGQQVVVQQQQPQYYRRPGVVVNGGVNVPYGGVGGTVIVR